MNLFHSARLKLTGFYFAVLLVFCLMLTLGVRAFTDHELHRGDVARSGAVYRIFDRLYSPDDQSSPPPTSGQYFANAERRQSDVTRQNLNRDFLWIDAGLLAIGALVSYWYARRTLRPIEEAHEQQKRFTSDASHELRTPLASMRLENEVFLRQKSFDETDARELIASNLEEVERLERLATNLLALNQYEQVTVRKQPAHIKAVVQAAVDAAQRTATTKDAVLSTKIAPGKVLIDQESIVELLGILLDNAAKYGPKKGPIEVTGKTEGSGYELIVRDHGPGIADEDLLHIFERMYRGDKARGSKIAGHGIGLSLAQQIATANGATLSAANHPKGGAMFTLSLT